MDTTFLNAFQEFEALGRAAVIADLQARGGFTDFRPTTDPYAPIDLYCQSPAGPVALEIKMRTGLYSSGQLLEEPKLQALLATLTAGEAKWAYYANVVAGQVWYWRIDERVLSLPCHTRALPGTTASPSALRQKQYRLLPLDWAIPPRP